MSANEAAENLHWGNWARMFALDLHHDLWVLSCDRDSVGNQLTEYLLHCRDPVVDLCWVHFGPDCSVMSVRAAPRTAQI